MLPIPTWSRVNSFFPLLATLALLGGCASKPTQEPAPAPVVTTDNQVTDVAAPVVEEDSKALRTTIYFDFDSSEIGDQYRAGLLAVAAEMTRNPRQTARLEGHTDSRGSREYNVGLGERRAQTVRRFLQLNGVVISQLATISYGEERPAAAGESEDAWSRNRRVEIVRTP